MGEKMRVDLCYSLLMDKDLIVYDEFTSVVDRVTAKYGSELFSNKVRKLGKKFVGISCHQDIVESMNPDWIFDTNKMEFVIPQKKKSNTELKSISQLIKDSGIFLESITI
jgi:ABC-type ATPase with predicted acetyltransferase domain